MVYLRHQYTIPNAPFSLFLPMQDRELPSFSLGLDSDSDTDPDPQTRPEQDQVPDSDDELDPTLETAPNPPLALRRLKRGPSTKQQLDPVLGSDPDLNVDDDIEDFSSQEGPTTDDKLPIQHHSICSSSKFPLVGKRVLPASLSSQSKATGSKEALHEQASASLKTKFNNSMFPELTPSPLRKFQLVDSDSDSDGPSMSKHANGGARTISSSANLSKQPAPLTQQKIKDTYNSVPIKADLWKDFSPIKSFRIPTPALDEFCQQLSHPVKDKAKSQTQTGSCISNGDGGLTENSHTDTLYQQESTNLPPSHRYFFHDDPNVRGLVRSRLPHFFPLSGANDRDCKQTTGSVINYTSQFGSSEASKKLAAQKGDVNKISRGRSRSISSTTNEISCPGSWVSCKASASSPKNAGKRRVQASEKSAGAAAGHWYTAPNGIKVYVTANGDELTGKSAYRYYKKESGRGFKKSKQKPKAGKKAKG